MGRVSHIDSNQSCARVGISPKKHGASVADLELRNTIVVSSVSSLSCFTRYKDTIFCRDTPLLQVQSLDFHSFFVAL